MNKLGLIRPIAINSRRPVRLSYNRSSRCSTHQLSEPPTLVWNGKHDRRYLSTNAAEAIPAEIVTSLAQDVSTSTSPSAGLVIAALFGLPLALWSYKCLMMVLFQRKIIYMGYIPPGARQETLDPKDPLLAGLEHEEIVIPSEPGVSLRGFGIRREGDVGENTESRRAVVIYFQGNVGSPIQRLPLFRKLLIESGSSSHSPSIDLDIVAVPPRSYGQSTNSRPTQRALLADYRNVVEHVTRRYSQLDERDGKRTKIIWYGHSLGASIATCLLSTVTPEELVRGKVACDGLIFENGFASIKGMVRTLYPQRFLPYYWLTPFVRDDWDAIGAFHSASSVNLSDSLLRTVPKLFVASERDEMVPTDMLKRVYEEAARANEAGVECTWLGIKDAMHDFAYQKPSWGKGLMGFIVRL